MVVHSLDVTMTLVHLYETILFNAMKLVAKGVRVGQSISLPPIFVPSNTMQNNDYICIWSFLKHVTLPHLLPLFFPCLATSN